MRPRFILILLCLSLAACTMQMEVITPASTDIELPTVTITPDVSQFEERTATPPAFPTSTFTSVPVDAGSTPIQFAPNGTYMDVIDGISYGTSKTYSVAASEGQIMSVSVKQGPEGEWTFIPMKIVGTDGTVLCPIKADGGCTAWRGALPSTQNYFITLSPPVDVPNFTLRVAIDPPGEKTQSFQYGSPITGTSFSYTDEFAPVRNPILPVTKSEPEIVLAYIDTQAYTGTNLVEAYLVYSSSSNPALVQTCTQPASLGGLEQVIDIVEIHGVPFVHSEAIGAATGNLYEQGIYRTERAGTCYEAVYVIHSVNAGAFLPQTVIAEFDRTSLIQKFEAIISTLVLK